MTKPPYVKRSILRENWPANYQDYPSLGSAAFEDYEEGVWFPTVRFQTTPATGMAYSSQSGNFVRVGNLIHISCNLNFTPNLGPAAGTLLIEGMPYPFASGVESFSLRNLAGGWVWPAGRTMVTLGAGGTTAILIIAQGSAGAGLVFAPANVTDGASNSINFAGAYRGVT